MIVARDNAVLIERVRSRCAPGTTPEAVAEIGHRDAFGTGEASIEDLHSALVAGLGYTGDWETFRDDWCCHLAVDPAMLAFVERLAARNRVLLFSNTNAVHWDFLAVASAGRLAQFEAYLSHEIGALKPDVGSYLQVARAAGIDPASSIFFDDRLENVEAARLAGFQSEVFTSQAALRDFLAERGLAVD